MGRHLFRPEAAALTRATPIPFDTAPQGLAAEMEMLGAVADGAAPASAFLWQVMTPGWCCPNGLPAAMPLRRQRKIAPALVGR